MFYIYHILARTPCIKVQVNPDRSTWCDSDCITVCGIVAPHSRFDDAPTTATTIITGFKWLFQHASTTPFQRQSASTNAMPEC